MFDLVIYDAVGRPFRGDTTEGIGGAEHFQILLAKRLAQAGLKVAVVNASPGVWEGDGVHYRSRFLGGEIECRALLRERASALPGNVIFDRLLAQVHDAATARDVNLLGSYLPRLQGTLVCVSEHQRSLYPAEWDVKVGGSFLHDLPDPVKKDPHLFVFASAAVKGYAETVTRWRALRAAHPEKFKDARLHVITSGYNRPLAVNDESVLHLGKLGDGALFELLNRAAGIFYVNAFAEMYPVPIAMAARLGTRVHALCLKGVGGMREAALGCEALVTEDEERFDTAFLAGYGSVWDRPERRRVGDEEWRESVAFWKEHIG